RSHWGRSLINVGKAQVRGTVIWKRSFALPAAPNTRRAVSRRDNVNLRRRAAVRGQTWTTLAALMAGHFNSYRQHEPGIIGIGTQPQFAIGQRALVVCTPNGNVLWDCIAMLDPATIALINGLSSLKAIAISHPHFYTTMVEWSRAFG